jgi:hypothetical protein
MYGNQRLSKARSSEDRSSPVGVLFYGEQTVGLRIERVNYYHNKLHFCKSSKAMAAGKKNVQMYTRCCAAPSELMPPLETGGE